MERAVDSPSSRVLTVRALTLRLDARFPFDGHDLRLAVTGAVPDRHLLHGHDGDSAYTYRLPRVRYFVRRGIPTLAGIDEGLPLLEEMMRRPPQTLRVRSQVFRVLGADIEDSVERFGPAIAPVEYRFVTPWLALNQENHRRYEQAAAEGRADLLARAAVGNLLSSAKGVEVFVRERLAAQVRVRPFPVRLKEIQLLGFVGRLVVNFDLPELWGLGKSVSRGFGIVRRAGPALRMGRP